jgi:transposase
MPWKECSVVEERLRFVARLLDGEAMTDVCREFGISRKTGYKIFDRYKEHGLEALTDRSRRPVRYANQLPGQVEGLIVSLKRNKPQLGRSQDQGTPPAAAARPCAPARQKYHPCRPRPARAR